MVKETSQAFHFTVAGSRVYGAAVFKGRITG